jgi:hypothetical protein
MKGTNMASQPDIVIGWEGPWPVGNYFSLPSDPDLDSGMGVYIIHTAGKGSELLFVGKTYSQAFAERIPQHRTEELAAWVDEHYKDEQLYLRVGHLVLKSFDRISAEIVDDVESLLIGCCEPLGNLSKTQTYSGREMVVRNDGARANLPRFCWAVPRKGSWHLFSDETPPS